MRTRKKAYGPTVRLTWAEAVAGAASAAARITRLAMVVRIRLRTRICASVGVVHRQCAGPEVRGGSCIRATTPCVGGAYASDLVGAVGEPTSLQPVTKPSLRCHGGRGGWAQPSTATGARPW